MIGAEIDWQRWFLFAVLGLPLLVWLVAGRDDSLRAVAVLAIVMFIQDTFVSRRYLLISVGPSLIVCYVAAMGLYLQRQRLPALRRAGVLWLLFVAAAAIAVIVGSVGTGLILLNLNKLQEYYLEGLLFFVFGMMVVDDDEELRRFFFWFSLVIVLGTALFHLFELLTGWRPSMIVQSVEQTGKGEGKLATPGGVFPNPNSLGSLYVMTIPVMLVQLLPGNLRGWRRQAMAAAFVIAGISMLMARHRGGLLFLPLVCGLALFLSGFSLARVVGGGVAVALLGALTWFAAGVVLPEFREGTVVQLAEEGLETNRLQTWWAFTKMAVDHPLGLGLDADTVKAIHHLYGTTLTSAHNIFIDRAVRTGILGFVAFLALVGHILLRNLRSLRGARADRSRYFALLYAVLPLVGYLAAGITEPIYDNGTKLTHLFWFLCGLSYAACARSDAAAPARARPPLRGWRAFDPPRLEHG
jgi:hypothetical protein